MHMLTKEGVMEELRKVHDPELKLDIVTLGLVYEVEIREKNAVRIKMTLTSPGCPYAPALLEAVKESCKASGAEDSEIELTFEPPWEPPEEVRWAIGGFSPWSM